MDYLAVKLLHQSAVALSIAGFALRGTASLFGAEWLRHRVARTLPHAVDTVLLLSGVTMAVMLRLSPTQAPWLAAKLVGLVIYVLLGSVALRPTRPRAVRAVAGLAALLTIGWMVSVAITKDPMGVFGALQ